MKATHHYMTRLLTLQIQEDDEPEEPVRSKTILFEKKQVKNIY
jgi:hypothetical protein